MPRALALVAAALTSALALTACSSGGSSPAPGPTGTAVSADRCAKNKAAGTITYITGFQFQASASILDVVAADALGYFRDECLTVKVQSGTGDTSKNAAYVAAGTAQMSDVGGQGDLLQERANGIDVTGVATFGHETIQTLMTTPAITDLTQLDGTTLGQKGQLPPAIQAMLVKAGVDLSSVKQITVDFNPVPPFKQDLVQSLTGYKSNEPFVLAAAGIKVTQWDPAKYDIPGTFGTVIANPAFAQKNPTAVQDFLRAALHATSYCQDHGEECVGYAKAASPAGYDSAHNLQVWKTESDLVRSSTPAGAPIGRIEDAEVTAEGQSLVENGALKALPDVEGINDMSYLDAVYNGTTLVWPAP